MQLPPPISEVIDYHFKLIPASTNISAKNDEFLQKHAQSPLHVHAALKVRQLLDSSKQAQNEKDLLATLDLPSISLDEACAGLSLLDEWNSDRKSKDAYIDSVQKQWPEAEAFQKD